MEKLSDNGYQSVQKQIGPSKSSKKKDKQLMFEGDIEVPMG